VGSYALYKNTTSARNTAIGTGALNSSTGAKNTATGHAAMYYNTIGSRNTASGMAALAYNTTGSYNTVIGALAGGYNTRGNRNVFIGASAGNHAAYQTQSNKLVIANGGTSANELITGDFAAHTVNINGSLHATGSVTTSDGRLKKDIQPLTHALDSILQLEGKTYRWKEGATFADKKDIGLIAQEVEQIFPELVAENEQGYKGIAYSKLTAVLIEAIKEQQQQFTAQMTTQQDQITAQQDKIAALKKENAQLKTIMAEQMDALLARVAMLEGVQVAAN